MSEPRHISELSNVELVSHAEEYRFLAARAASEWTREELNEAASRLEVVARTREIVSKSRSLDVAHRGAGDDDDSATGAAALVEARIAVGTLIAECPYRDMAS